MHCGNVCKRLVVIHSSDQVRQRLVSFPKQIDTDFGGDDGVWIILRAVVPISPDLKSRIDDFQLTGPNVVSKNDGISVFLHSAKRCGGDV